METINGDGAKELLEAEAHIWKYTFNYITSMSLKCAVQLGIPDIISNHAKPITLSELVKALSIPEMKSTHLYRLMRILVHSGFFAVEKFLQDQEGYVLTLPSRLLLKNRGTNISPFSAMMVDPVFVTPCQFMGAWFQGTGSSPFEAAHGMDIWSYFSQHTDVSKSFNAAMGSDAKFVTNMLVKEWKGMFEGFGSLVDVGGGTGTVAKVISEAFPLLSCTVFDLPHVVSNMKGSKNLKFVGGDMFVSIPSADIILLKWVMHDWTDRDCVKILKRCKEALPRKEGKVIIIEIVIDEDKSMNEATGTQLCFDILMMAVANGIERTEMEWEKLFLDAGFTSYKITHGLGLRSIIEVFP